MENLPVVKEISMHQKYAAPLKNVSLEITPKPMFKKDDEFILELFRGVFKQWYSLTKEAETVSLLWWLSDGTDILVYNRNMDEPIEWMFWQGFAHPTYDVPIEKDPKRDSITATPYIYRPDAITLTAADVKRIVSLIRSAGMEIIGKRIRVGLPFDPGCEFSNHPFRYRDHPELLMGEKMKCIDCTAALHADPRPFAGFPNGVDEGTKFGRFFGRQVSIYLRDMDVDYIWLSNSFGFGRSPYATGGVGQFFDGLEYHPKGNAKISADILDFWRMFREEIGDLEIECRGTDFSLGLNLVNHATPYLGMFSNEIGVAPPPNTPWPALTFNHGIALAGYMSQIAAAPGDTLPMRFYTADPWFCNSPWLDRWNRRPHDIYLTGAVSRIWNDGSVLAFNDVKFLSLDSSWGETLDVIPDEVIPHIKRAVNFRPNAPAPVLWVYPVREYHEYTFDRQERIDEVMAGDLLIQHAINCGLPLSGVINTDAFVETTSDAPGRYLGSVLVTPVPDSGSKWAAGIEAHIKAGGKVLLYGPADHSDNKWLEMIGLEITAPIHGDLRISISNDPDIYSQGQPALKFRHEPAHNGGGMCEVARHSADSATRILARAYKGDQERVASLVHAAPEWNGGKLAWVRGTTSVTVDGVRGRNLSTDDPSEHYPCENLLRHALAELGWSVVVERPSPGRESVHLMVSRTRNGFVFAGFSPLPEAVLHLKTPLGAPVFPGRDFDLTNGATHWPVWHWFHEECRVFVVQEEGRISMKPVSAKHPLYRRRWLLDGLKDATVRFFPETGCEGHTNVLLNTDQRYFILGDAHESTWIDSPHGRYLEMRGITGVVSFAWANDENIEPVKPRS